MTNNIKNILSKSDKKQICNSLRISCNRMLRDYERHLNNKPSITQPYLYFRWLVILIQKYLTIRHIPVHPWYYSQQHKRYTMSSKVHL